MVHWRSISVLILVITTQILGQQGQDCVDTTGRRYLRGQSWQTGCNKYQCEFDGVRLLQQGCMKADNTCFYEGETYEYHCFTYRCDVENGRAVRRETYAGCSKADGSCYAVGESYKYFCYEYRCSLKGGLPRREMTSQACSYFERCVAVGETISHGRRQYRCAARNDGQLVWERVRQGEFPGCYTEGGALVPVGGTRREECSVYRCAESGPGTFKLELQSTGCKNSRGECVDVGTSRFACNVNGRFELNCVCRAKNGGVAVLDAAAALRPEESKQVSAENLLNVPGKCSAPGTGSPMSVGSVVVFDCAEYLCEEGIVTDQPKLRVLGRDCRTAEGWCIRPGTKTFPCFQGGRRHEKCKCSVGRDGQINYSVMPDKCTAKDGARVRIGYRHMIDCVTYRCQEDGSMKRISQGCKSAEGRCMRLGAENFSCRIDGVRHDKCKCILNMEGEVEYLVDIMKTTCTAQDGTIVEEGKTHSKDCIQYRCTKSGRELRLVPIKTECQTSDGSCLPVGSTNFRCSLNGRSATCECHTNDDGTLVYSEYVEQTGCVSLSGRVLQEGEKEEVDCAFHVCRREGNEYKLMPHSVDCRTAEGRCVPAGTRGFPCMIDGSRVDQCECEVSALGQVQYKRLQEFCTSRYGQKVAENERIQIECAEYLCVRESGTLSLNVQSLGCQTATGDCLPVPSENFRCLINGVEYENCQCSTGDSGQVVYSAKSLQGVDGCKTPAGDVIKADQSVTVDCVTYECTKEENTFVLKPKEMECKTADGDCLVAGSVGFACDIRGVRYERCRCDINSEGQVLYSALASECTAQDGTKVKVGDSYHHHCSEYRCKEQGSGLLLDLVKTECRTSDGDCVAVGTEQFPCLISGEVTPYCTCKQDDKSGDLIYYKNGCDFKGEFLARDARKTVDCVEYQCQMDGDSWLVTPLSIECQTADGECLPVGSDNFPCLDNAGQKYDNCRCDLDASQKVVYSLKQSECPVGHFAERDVVENSIKIGQTVTSQCVTYTCQTADNGGLELAVTNVACKSLYGECKPLGSQGFPCQLGPHCQCQMEGDHITYSVYGCTLESEYVAPGDYKEVNCTEYTCKKEGDRYFIDVSLQIGCPGHDGTCYPAGSAPFQCRVQGEDHERCLCEKDPEGKLSYVITRDEEPATTVPVPTVPTTEAKPRPKRSDRRAGYGEDGTKEGNCYFPFTHEGAEYSDCTKVGESSERAWCPITDNYPDDKSIGYCFPKSEKKTKSGTPCAFPFSYNDVLYYDCVYAWTGDWCATTADYDADGEYGTCA